MNLKACKNTFIPSFAKWKDFPYMLIYFWHEFIMFIYLLICGHVGQFVRMKHKWKIRPKIGILVIMIKTKLIEGDIFVTWISNKQL